MVERGGRKQSRRMHQGKSRDLVGHGTATLLKSTVIGRGFSSYSLAIPRPFPSCRPGTLKLPPTTLLAFSVVVELRYLRETMEDGEYIAGIP